MKNLKFPKIKGRVLFNEPLWRHTTFRIGGPCRAWAEPADEGELKKVLKFAASEGRETFVIGAGSNVLFGGKGFDGILIHLGQSAFKNVRFSGRKAAAGAGVSLGRLINLACGAGLSGIEGLVGIPGTLGGAVFMNSGYEGSISDCLEEAKVIDKSSGRVRIVKGKGIFGDSVILEAALKLRKGDKRALFRKKSALLRAKKKSQPLGALSAGCVFKNPEKGLPAGKLIEMLHLAGKRIGGAEVSEKHANFIVNVKSAKASDVTRLIELVKRRVKSEFDTELKPEIVIV